MFIDRPLQTLRLLFRLDEAVPLPAWTTPELEEAWRENGLELDVPAECTVTEVHYGGDEGGIICKLDFGPAAAEEEFYASITYLRFSSRLPLALEIATYQKHRLKRLRRALEAA
jgi:hypothetical protein